MLMPRRPLMSQNGARRSAERVGDAGADLARPALEWRQAPILPAADVAETTDAIVVKMDLPGHTLEEIQVTVEDDVLSIRSERRQPGAEDGRTYHRSELGYGVYARAFTLPASVDAQKTEARYENGVLVIVLPKREEAKPRAIEVKIG